MREAAPAGSEPASSIKTAAIAARPRLNVPVIRLLPAAATCAPQHSPRCSKPRDASFVPAGALGARL